MQNDETKWVDAKETDKLTMTLGFAELLTGQAT